jgi:hypothetical protein
MESNCVQNSKKGLQSGAISHETRLLILIDRLLEDLASKI